MLFPPPTPPASLGTYAREVLEYFAGHEAASDIVIGGGIALAHYLDYRDTFDLDATLVAAWSPVRIESLRDNVASKMTALVERGAPRDLRDIHELCRRAWAAPSLANFSGSGVTRFSRGWWSATS